MSTIIQNTTDLQSLLDKVNELPNAGSGGDSDPVLQDKTVTPTTSKQTITADSGYDGLDTVTVNAMPTVTQATPSITVSSAGLITASSTQTAGYVTSGTTSSTKQLTVQAAQTITPSTSNKTIASGRYLTGTQTIKGDSNLVAGNIKNGVSIFGVTGTHSGGEDLDAVIAEQEALITELSTALDNKASGGSGGTDIKTCTVTFTRQSGIDFYGISCTTFSNGQVGVFAKSTNGDDFIFPMTIPNVICNSAIHVNAITGSNITGYQFTGGAALCRRFELEGLHIFQAGNEDCSITMYDDD